MKPSEFTKVVVPLKYLSPAEVLNVYLYVNSLPEQRPECLFNTTPRGPRVKGAELWVKSYEAGEKSPARGWTLRESDGKVSVCGVLQI